VAEAQISAAEIQFNKTFISARTLLEPGTRCLTATFDTPYSRAMASKFNPALTAQQLWLWKLSTAAAIIF